MIGKALAGTALVLFLLSAGSGPGAVRAQPRDPIEAALDRMTALYRDGKFEEAAPFAEEALNLSEARFGGDHPTTAVMLNNLAEIYRELGDFAEAEPLHRRALDIRARKLGPQSRQAVESMFNLARIYDGGGNDLLAEQLYVRSVPLLEDVLNPGHPAVGIALSHMAAFYRAQGRIAEAEKIEAHAREIKAKAR